MRKQSIPVLKSFTIDGQTADIDAVLKASFEDIGEAAGMLPSYIGWFGYQKGKANERVINNKYKLKEAEAKAYFDLKNGGFMSQGFGEKMTEAALERAVTLAPEVKAASEAYARAEKDYDWITATIKAIEAKMELLRSIEATRRMEHEPDKRRNVVE
jgi:hypothetical protein